MLQDRILDTVKFFNSQELPVTAFEIYKYLIPSKSQLESVLDESYELKNETNVVSMASVDTVIAELDLLVASSLIERKNGYYCLPTKAHLIDWRLRNYTHGIIREKLINRYIPVLQFMPFVRGVALNGSQALGRQSKESDIDLFIITDSNFLWTARTFVTFALQILGARRHGAKIADRFCLNHYLASPKSLDRRKNLYTAFEYAKLRPLVYSQTVLEFKKNNLLWISQFFSNIDRFNQAADSKTKKSKIQALLEKIFNNQFGLKLESMLETIQSKRIRLEKYIVVEKDELSFHPQSKERALLQNFFKNQTS